MQIYANSHIDFAMPTGGKPTHWSLAFHDHEPQTFKLKDTRVPQSAP